MYSLILFDIDGVLLSEERYFDASALTVYEMITGASYLGLRIPNDAVDGHLLQASGTDGLADDVIAAVRGFVFHQDAVLDFMKRRGINANWDMVYLQFSCQLVRTMNACGVRVDETLANTDALSGHLTRQHLQQLGNAIRTQSGGTAARWADFTAVYESCENKQDLFEAVRADFVRLAGVPADKVQQFTSELWDIGQEAFQDWYLGEPYRETETAIGKAGFLNYEVPLADPGQLAIALQQFRDRGVALGVATGRPETETYVPLRLLGWLDRFDENRISTASDVLRAQRAIPDAPTLSKPHPFSYLRSYLSSPDVDTVLAYPLPLKQDEARKVLIVGDSVADWMAAKAIGCDFAAVLTGLSGTSARAQFETLGCTYIWNNVMDVATLLN
jgi:phosphoglycolate phosphatase-like HAD superfamily hydrolase